MQDSLLAADRAVADRDAVEIGGDAEAYAAAVTSALHLLHDDFLQVKDAERKPSKVQIKM
jgi:hypothetical protein